MIFEPRPYQGPAYQHVLNTPRSALWLGMGLGKTGISLEAIATLHMLSEISNVLVLAPKRVARSTWPNEVAKWENFRHMGVVPIVGAPSQRKQAVKTEALIHTINYENVPWLVKGWGRDWPYDFVIADESTKLKGLRISPQVSKTGKRFLRKSAGSGVRVAHLAKVAHDRVRYWLNLTGTPAPNGLLDLWGQSWFLDEGARLGRTYTSFQQRWFRKQFNGYGFEPLEHADREIHERLSDLCLSMEAKDHFDLPDLVLNVIPVRLPPRAEKLYRSMERDMFMELAGEGIEAFNAASRTMKCLQLANGAAYLADGRWEEVHDAKLEALQEVIEEAAGAPIIVAYHFRSDLARIKAKFPQARELDDNPRTETDWNAGKIPLLLAHPDSAGHGLNLQYGGNILVFFGHWWNLESYQQMIERIGPTRQAQAGFDRPVFVHHIIAENTVDELVSARRETKRSVQDLLMEAMKRR